MPQDQDQDVNRARQLYQDPDGQELLKSAAAERESASQNTVEFCAIINARSGRCSEDCAFCAQSAHYRTDFTDGALTDTEAILAYAKKLEGYGVKRLSLVSSGRGVTDKELDKFLSIYSLLRERTRLSLCASHGIITPAQARRLKDAGVTRYHHNLETSENYFPNICTTHTYQERLATVHTAREAGLEICCGGLIGLGESDQDRIDLAFSLKHLGVASIPLNVLMPVRGTPLENNEITGAAELLRTAALFRYANPTARLRFAGGRPLFDTRTQLHSLKYGFDGLMIGDYLTKKGMDIEADINNLKNNGFYILK